MTADEYQKLVSEALDGKISWAEFEARVQGYMPVSEKIALPHPEFEVTLAWPSDLTLKDYEQLYLGRLVSLVMNDVVGGSGRLLDLKLRVVDVKLTEEGKER